jgi:structural maintenance of chromosome 1
VPERQQLDTLRRERKTLRDALASAEDKVQQAERAKANKSTEVADLEEREKAVSLLELPLLATVVIGAMYGMIADGQMSEKVKSIDDERDGIKASIDAAQAERSRIKSVGALQFGLSQESGADLAV